MIDQFEDKKFRSATRGDIDLTAIGTAPEADDEPSPAEDSASSWYPFLVLTVGMAVVLGGIILLRVNAFLALLAAALVVSFMAGGSADSATGVTDPVVRVVEAFAGTTGAIGIVIALAAVIGEALMRSGAADRIVRTFLAVLGEKRSATAMMSSGFVLSVPVFFDTAFYLLVPLARSLYRTTGRHYLKYLMAIGAGAVNQAIKAVAIARGYLQEDGLDVRVIRRELRDSPEQ